MPYPEESIADESRKPERKFLSEYIVNNDWYDTCNTNKSFPLLKLLYIKTQKSSIIFLSASSDNKRLLQLVIFSVSSWRTNPHHSLFATYSEKKSAAYDFRLRCLLQGGACYVINNLIRKIITNLPSPATPETFDFEPHCLIQGWACYVISTLSFYGIHTKRITKVYNPARYATSCFNGTWSPTSPYALIFPSRPMRPCQNSCCTYLAT